jgi:hypothetical protein
MVFEKATSIGQVRSESASMIDSRGTLSPYVEIDQSALHAHKIIHFQGDMDTRVSDR